MSGNQLSYIVVPTLYNHHFSSYARGFVVSPCSPWTLPAWGTWRHDPWWQRNSTRAAAWGRTSRSRRGCRLDRPGSAWWVGWGLGQRFGATPSHQVTSFLMVTIWSCWRYPVFRQTYLLWTKCYMDTGFWPIASRGLSWMNLQRLKPVFLVLWRVKPAGEITTTWDKFGRGITVQFWKHEFVHGPKRQSTPAGV